VRYKVLSRLLLEILILPRVEHFSFFLLLWEVKLLFRQLLLFLENLGLYSLFWVLCHQLTFVPARFASIIPPKFDCREDFLKSFYRAYDACFQISLQPLLYPKLVCFARFSFCDTSNLWFVKTVNFIFCVAFLS